MKIVMLATHSTESLDNMIASVERARIHPVKLGWGEQWKGWKWRLEKYLEYCNIITKEDPNEILVFVDAFDVLCVRKDVNYNFDSAFKSFHSDIVFSSEWWCGSAKNCGSTHTFHNGTMCLLNEMDLTNDNKNVNVNVGFVCGKAHALAKMYSDVLAQTQASLLDFDDQKAIADWIDSDLSKLLTLSLDRKGILCKTIHVLDSVSTIDTIPFFVHFPGPMLKIGLFPHYNLNARAILGEKAKPLLDYYHLVFLFFCILVTSFVLSS